MFAQRVEMLSEVLYSPSESIYIYSPAFLYLRVISLTILIYFLFSVSSEKLGLFINSILLPKFFWPTERKKMLQWSKKTFEIRGWKPRIFKIFEITRTIYSNRERSEQFLVTECFFNLFLEISQISKNRTIIIQIGKNYWDLEICRKS